MSSIQGACLCLIVIYGGMFEEDCKAVEGFRTLIATEWVVALQDRQEQGRRAGIDGRSGSVTPKTDAF